MIENDFDKKTENEDRTWKIQAEGETTLIPESWAPKEWFRKIHGIYPSFISRRSAAIHSMAGFGSNGHPITLYNISDVLAIKKEMLLKPQVSSDSGLFVDSENESWAPESWLIDRYGVSRGIISPFLKKAQFIDGISRGKGVRFYKLSAVVPQIETVIKQPRVNEIGVHVDENNNRWILTTALCEKYGIDPKTINKRLKEIKQIGGIGNNGHEVILYDEVEANRTLEEYISLPKAQGDIYEDESGEKWMTLKYYQRKTGISPKALIKRLVGLETKKARIGSGQENTLYPQSKVEQRLKELQALPQVSPETGIFIDETEEAWAPARFLIDKYGVSQSVLNKRLKDIKQIRGKDKSRQERILYNVREADNVLTDFIALPAIDPETERYVDHEGVSWITLDFAQQLIGNVGSLKDVLKVVSQVRGRGINGSETVLYNEQELRENYKEHLALPKIEEVIDAYIDSEGSRWVPAATFMKALKIGRSTLDPYLLGVPTRGGRSKKGKVTALYKESEVNQNLKSFLSLPRVDRQTGRYVDSNGEGWVSIYTAAHNLGVDVGFLSNRLEGVQSIEGRDKVNRKTTLYNEADLAKVITTRKRHEKGYWTIEKTDQEALEFFQQKGELNRSALEKADRHDLVGTITLYSGFKALKVRLGIVSAESNENLSLSSEEANTEFMRILRSYHG